MIANKMEAWKSFEISLEVDLFISLAEFAIGRDASVASFAKGIGTEEVGGIGSGGRIGSAVGLDGDGISLVARIGGDEIS